MRPLLFNLESELPNWWLQNLSKLIGSLPKNCQKQTEGKEVLEVRAKNNLYTPECKENSVSLFSENHTILNK